MTHIQRLVAAACAGLFAALPARAAQWGDFDLTGFVLDEFSFCDNCAVHPVNPQGFDPRGVPLVFGKPVTVNLPGVPGHDTENLFLYMLSAGAHHEFDNAVAIEARVTTRQRNYHADIYGQNIDEAYVGASYPLLGAIHYGTMFTRSWSRADAFAYPFGVTDEWSEAGAGYGLTRRALRLTSREFEPALGKFLVELTYAMPRKEYPLNDFSPVYAPPPQPRMLEAFVQFSNQRNLIEAVYQHSSGGLQSSFAEGAFVGAAGNTDSAAAAAGYQPPSETLAYVEGNYWFAERWKFTWGVKRSWWSGLQQQCDYSPAIQNCYFDQAGFNYAIDGKLHSATTYDALLGLAYTEGLWTFTGAMVRMNKAYTKTPTEWGQSNTATFGTLGVYRKIPQLSSHLDTSVYAELSRVQYGRQDPAPMDMPNNTAFTGVDPRVSRSGNTLTVGTKLIF